MLLCLIICVYMCKVRLQRLMSTHKLKYCGLNNGGYGGKCIASSDIDELWDLYIEVQYSYN